MTKINRKFFNSLTNDNETKQRKEIQASRLLCTAKAKRKDGLVHVVAVYEMSNHNYFFFEYTAKTKRTPRRLWKVANYKNVWSGKIYDPTGKPGKVTIQNFLKSLTWHVEAGAKWTIRYPHKAKQFHARVETATYIPKAEELPALPNGTWEYAAAKSSGRNQHIGKHRRRAYDKVNRSNQ